MIRTEGQILVRPPTRSWNPDLPKKTAPTVIRGPFAGMGMRYHAIAMILLMIGAALAGCTADDTSTDDGGDTGGDTGGTTNQTTNDTAGNGTTNGGNGTTDGGNGTADNGNGTTNNTVQYIGFMDNSTMHGYRLDPSNFSRIFMPINEENCTTTGDADWLGVWNEPLCVQDYGNNITYNETLDCLTASNDTMELCVVIVNMRISNRVMWYKFTDDDVCGVFINSEQFIPSSTYNLTYGIPIDWDDLWNDSAFVAWEDERIDAYNNEVANQPSWCTNPKLNYLYWAIQPAS